MNGRTHLCRASRLESAGYFRSPGHGWAATCSLARQPEAAWTTTMQLLHGKHRGSPKALRVLVSRCGAVCLGIALLVSLSLLSSLSFRVSDISCPPHLCMGTSTSKASVSSTSLDANAMTQATPIAQALSKVQNLVAQNPLVIFSKTYCPFCRKVKQLFAEVGARGTIVELDEEADGANIQNALTSWTGQRTVPNVFIGGKHIGGCDDTVALQKQGKLLPLLKAAGAVQEEAQAA